MTGLAYSRPALRLSTAKTMRHSMIRCAGASAVPLLFVLQMDAADRSCTVSVHCSNHRVKMLVTFPAQYPNNAAPSFQFINPTTITSAVKAKLLKVRLGSQR